MDSIEELRYLVLGAQREGNRILSDLLRPLGLSPSQAEVLSVLLNVGPLSLGEVGGRLVCESGSPSRLVDGLVATELVERIPSTDDRRRVVLSLTKEGRRIARTVGRLELELHTLIGALVTSDDVAVVNRVLWLFIEGRAAGDAMVLRMHDRSSGT
jgi:DNA-binding MarR family transcriptional regulator